MSLLPFLRELAEVEKSIEVHDSKLGRKKIIRAYVVVPDRGQLNDLPCIFNWPERAEDRGGLGSVNENLWTISIECCVYDANWEQASQWAIAFYDATRRRLMQEKPADKRFNGTVSNVVELRTPSKTDFLSARTWAEKSCASFVIELDVELFEDVA